MFLPESILQTRKRRLESRITPWSAAYGGESHFRPESVRPGFEWIIERETETRAQMVTRWGLSDSLRRLTYSEAG